jgi:hypothetical protein
MRIRPIVEHVLYALAAMRHGQLHPRLALVMDAKHGPRFVRT